MIQQRLTLKQQARILPQQIQLLNIFHLTHMELEQRIIRELEENPLLEETVPESEDSADPSVLQRDFADWDEYGYDDIPDYRTEYANYFSEQILPEKPMPQGPDFRLHLKEQVGMLARDGHENFLACFIIDSLNESGLLEQGLPTLAEDISFQLGKWIEPEALEEVLKMVQGLEPAGIAARNIRECLMLQLARLDNDEPVVKDAFRLIGSYYEELNSRQFHKIMSEMHLTEQQLLESLELIASMNMRPIALEQDEIAGKNYIIPDFIVSVEEDELVIALTQQRSATLTINRAWMDSIRNQCASKDMAANYYLKSKLQSAEWFVSAIAQREQTMLSIMKSIVKWQHDYFRAGDPLLLKPMILKNIAEDTGYDISTVSRITSNKYVAAPFGNVSLKDLFAEGLPTGTGEMVSSRVVQEAIKEVVSAEDKRNPLTDHQLVTALARQGFRIARRTVAKYREMLKIPTAQLRALWK